ncbi:hlyIII-domain-containing protein [Moesziomyces antarcticus]|uniref:Related to IZH3 - membrane protein involved in zinc ion homeostasis n=1 Tax=Pseudozyma antarctica TaxID=84753 RepID=A0A5C3FFM9_PSEA2|nr:hlyIII-domain-containing protein [Moesziomyces antarcticus]GAK62661.1 hlyIII-domain-containing protein [Moesziomyces antarcticus]SPO43223.1 related to IZH3 - membrane protein involved in zinc ion homeostasis [Moesziomyces antarcticus]
MPARRPSLSASRSTPLLESSASKRAMLASSAVSDEPTRPFNVRRRLRRASQPAGPSQSTLRFRLDALAPEEALAEGFSSATATATATATDSGSSDDEWDATYTDMFSRPRHQSLGSLEYLDLPASLPYSIVSLRAQLLSYLTELEMRAKAFYSMRISRAASDPAAVPCDSTTAASASSNSEVSGQDLPSSDAAALNDGHSAAFFQQLEALREDLRRLVALLPTYPASASSALASRSQTLAQDWERLSSSFSFPISLGNGLRERLPRLPSSSDAARLRAELPSLPSMPSFPQLDLDFASVLEPLSSHLPSQAYALAAKMQARLETLQESVRNMAWRDCLQSAAANDGEDHTSLAQRFETKLMDLSVRSRARANSFAERAGHAVHEAEEKLYQLAIELARNGQELISYEHLPAFFRNNEHILSGYRFIPVENWRALVRSTFQIHNETGNIHTHLWGLAAIVPLFWPSKGLDEQTTPMDRLVQTVYLLAAAKCLTLSVSWHVMAGCSDRKWFERFACVDYTGIAWLVAASIWTTVYNCFYCQPNLALFYSFTTLVVGLAGAILPWAEWFNRRENKGWRIAVFLTMCFTALAPFSHAAFEHGLAKTMSFFSPIFPSLAFYVGGLVFYATQFPESWKPGRFDTWGHSHQLWHIGIVLAIVFHYRAALLFHANRFEFSCAVPGASMAAGGGAGASVSPSVVQRLLGLIAWTQPLSATGKAAATVSRPIDSMFAKVGGMEGIIGLARADDQVLQWRRLLGKIGNGAVGRGWDALVDWAQNFW